MWNVLSLRALNPDAPLPEPSLSVLKPILPPEWNDPSKIADCITDIASSFDLNQEPERLADEPVDIITATQKTQPPTL